MFAPLKQANAFRPDVEAIARFLADDRSPKAVFLNSPHNPTGGVATREDLCNIADLIRGRETLPASALPVRGDAQWQTRQRLQAAMRPAS